MASLILSHNGQLYKVANIGAGFMPAHVAARFAVGDKPRRYKSDEHNPIFNGEISMSSPIIHRRGVEIEAFLPFISPFAETPESKIR